MSTTQTKPQKNSFLAGTANYVDERVGASGILKEFGRKIFAATVVDLSNVMVGIADCGFQPSAELVEKIAD